MARAPITNRIAYSYKINRYLDERLPFDWNVVETELGTMVEPRQLVRFIDGSVPQVDLVDSAFDSQAFMSPEEFQSTYNHGGPQLMVDFNY